MSYPLQQKVLYRYPSHGSRVLHNSIASGITLYDPPHVNADNRYRDFKMGSRFILYIMYIYTILKLKYKFNFLLYRSNIYIYIN
jgi:hypothetical protein